MKIFLCQVLTSVPISNKSLITMNIYKANGKSPETSFNLKQPRKGCKLFYFKYNILKPFHGCTDIVESFAFYLNAVVLARSRSAQTWWMLQMTRHYRFCTLHHLLSTPIATILCSLNMLLQCSLFPVLLLCFPIMFFVSSATAATTTALSATYCSTASELIQTYSCDLSQSKPNKQTY